MNKKKVSSKVNTIGPLSDIFFFFKWIYMHLNVSFKICAKLLWNQIQKSLCSTCLLTAACTQIFNTTQMTITQFLSKLKINMYIFPEKSQTNNKEIQLKAFHSLLPVSYVAYKHPSMTKTRWATVFHLEMLFELSGN